MFEVIVFLKKSFLCRVILYVIVITRTEDIIAIISKATRYNYCISYLPIPWQLQFNKSTVNSMAANTCSCSSPPDILFLGMCEFKWCRFGGNGTSDL